MKLYTRTGDDGTTSLFDGTRVPKDHLRVAAYGDVDETNSFLGFAICGLFPNRRFDPAVRELCERMAQIQSELFVVGSDLATPVESRVRDKAPAVTAEQVTRLERWIDDATEAVAPLHSFILPGGCEAACRLHLARTVARRAERSVITLARVEPVGDQIIPYINRLTDLLFAWARQANHLAETPDVPWHAPERS